jgi:hypothetical protein
MRDGIEPPEPWMPETYHYHSASAIIENGDYEAAVAAAKNKAKQSLVTPIRHAAETPIAAVAEGSASAGG